MFATDNGCTYVDLGVEVVHDCLCGEELKVENWVWSHRQQIARYLKKRTALQLAQAKENAQLVGGIKL